MNKIKGKVVSNYVGKMYEFVLPDGTRRHITVRNREGMKEARELLTLKLASE